MAQTALIRRRQEAPSLGPRGNRDRCRCFRRLIPPAPYRVGIAARHRPVSRVGSRMERQQTVQRGAPRRRYRRRVFEHAAAEIPARRGSS